MLVLLTFVFLTFAVALGSAIAVSFLNIPEEEYVKISFEGKEVDWL